MKFVKVALWIIIPSLIVVGWVKSPSTEEQEKERQFTAQIMSAEPALVSECIGDSWWTPAPVLEVTLDREVTIKNEYGDAPVKTRKLYALLIDYSYVNVGGKRTNERVDYLQILNSSKDSPKIWNYFAFTVTKNGCQNAFLIELNWKEKYQK